MPRLLLLACLAALIMATPDAGSSQAIATSPVISTATVSAASESLSASFSTLTSIATITLQSSVTVTGSSFTIYSGADYSTYTSTTVILSAITQYDTIISTIGSTTVFVAVPTANTGNSSSTESAIGIISPTATTLSTTAKSSGSPGTSVSHASTASSSTPVSGSRGTVANSKHLSGGAIAGIFLAVAFITLSIAAAVFIHSDHGDFFAPAGVMMSEIKRLSAAQGRVRSQAWPAAEMSELRTDSELDERVSPGSVEKSDRTPLSVDALQLPPLQLTPLGGGFVWDRPRSIQSLTALPLWSGKRWK